ncbi:MAG: hypothetical protein AAGA76_15130 [Pseudomonadota bacterium]
MNEMREATFDYMIASLNAYICVVVLCLLEGLFKHLIDDGLVVFFNYFS